MHSSDGGDIGPERKNIYIYMGEKLAKQIIIINCLINKWEWVDKIGIL